MPSTYLNIGFEGILNIYNLLRIFSDNLFINDVWRPTMNSQYFFLKIEKLIINDYYTATHRKLGYGYGILCQ